MTKLKWKKEPTTGWRTTFVDKDGIGTHVVVKRAKRAGSCKFALDVVCHGPTGDADGGEFTLSWEDVALYAASSERNSLPVALGTAIKLLLSAGTAPARKAAHSLGWVKFLTDAERTEIMARLESAPDGKKDFHRACAAEMHGVAYDDVDENQRKVAKDASFCYLYGSASKGGQNVEHKDS